MKLGTETNNLFNFMMTNSQQPVPKVGDGATICCWSDRRAATIVKVTDKTVHVQQDIAKRIDKNGMSDMQDYEYSPNPNAPIDIFRVTKKGLRDKCGNGLSIGVRREYYDYSF